MEAFLNNNDSLLNREKNTGNEKSKRFAYALGTICDNLISIFIVSICTSTLSTLQWSNSSTISDLHKSVLVLASINIKICYKIGSTSPPNVRSLMSSESWSYDDLISLTNCNWSDKLIAVFCGLYDKSIGMYCTVDENLLDISGS